MDPDGVGARISRMSASPVGSSANASLRVCLRPIAWAICALVALGGPAAQAAAQTVTGTVREAESLRSLPTALVELLDQSGTRVATTVGAQDGSFVLTAPVDGTYRLRARILGFEEASSEPFVLRPESSIRRDVLASRRVVRLDGIRASASKSCRSLSAAGPELAAVWGDARTALETVAWTARTGALVFHVSEYRRTLDESTLEVEEATEELRRGVYTGSPYVSVPADTLLVHGYVRRAADGSRVWNYWAPDAEILLSDAFLETHCFDIHPESDGTRVGLLFEPVADREVPEIEGALWLDRESSELHSLEFRYVNLPSDHPTSPHLGGEVEFENLATGVWMVRNWRIRVPNVEFRMRAAGIRRVIDSFVEHGARVMRVGTVDGETLADAVGATLTGTVRMDPEGRPLPGAELQVVATDRRAAADPDGRYRLGDLPTGTFEVRVWHPWLEVLGRDAVRRTVTLEEGRTARLAVDLGIAEAVDRFCPEVPRARIVHGVVRDASLDRPIAGVGVRPGADAAGTADVSDAMGRWAVCVDAALDSVPLALLSATGAERVRTVARLDEDPLVDVALEVDLSDLADPRRVAVDEVSERIGETLRGVVYEAGSDTPVAGARIVLHGGDRSVLAQTESGADGEFVVPSSVGGFQLLAVERQGYAELTVAGDLRARADSAGSLALRLYPAPIELDGLEASVDGPSPSERLRRLRLDANGFHERREAGFGDFFTPEMIEARMPTFFSDIVVRLPGVQVDNGILKVRGNQGPCEPNIWIDGILVLGGDPASGFSWGGNNDELRRIDDRISAGDVMAVEVYRTISGTPLRFTVPNATCATILIWTK